MARRRNYRRSYSRRTPNAYTWQSYVKHWEPDSVAADTNKSYIVDYITPGVGDGSIHNETPFDAPHVLERTRGVMYHGVTTANQADVFALTVAMAQIPAGVIIDTSDIPSVLDNREGDDYFFYETHVCGDEPESNVDKIDSKAKRKFDVGAKIAILANINNYGNSVTADAEIVINLRLLWKLGK